jgi:hypothetical protein
VSSKCRELRKVEAFSEEGRGIAESVGHYKSRTPQKNGEIACSSETSQAARKTLPNKLDPLRPWITAPPAQCEGV